MRFKELPARIFAFIIMVMLAIILWFLNDNFTGLLFFNIDVNFFIDKGYETLLVLSVIYLIFKILFEGSFQRGIKDYKARYSFKKVVSVLYYAIALLALVTIWLGNPQDLIVAYGLIGAGVAIGLQDVFKNFVGGVFIITNKTFSVGDRIEMAGIFGDVIDIGIFYTTMMEIRGWVSGDQASGRISILPNSHVLTGSINNYTKDHKFIWDEITIPLTYDSDWKMARDKFFEIATKETQHVKDEAEKGLSILRDKYYAEQIRSLEPKVFVKLTDNWIELSIRYTASVYDRRSLNDSIMRALLELIETSSGKIKIASATFDIVGFPELKITKMET